MLKAVKQLASGERSRVGNHWCSDNPEHTRTLYHYHGTCICEVDDNTKQFEIKYRCGWSTQSTITAMNSYKQWFNDHDYTEVFTYYYDMLDKLVMCPTGCMLRYHYGNLAYGRFEVTICTYEVAGKKFAEVVIAEQKDGAEAITITVEYRGPKTLKSALDKKMAPIFPL